SVRGSVFRTDKINAREPDPNDPTLNVLAGGQRVKGFEVEANGHVTRRWQVFSGYAYLDGKVAKSNAHPEFIGLPLGNVPRNTFTLWNTYDTPWRFELGGGSQFVDSRTASSTAPFDPTTGKLKQVPGYWTFNAMARYPINDHLDLQANVYNLTNKYYYDQ